MGMTQVCMITVFFRRSHRHETRDNKSPKIDVECRTNYCTIHYGKLKQTEVNVIQTLYISSSLLYRESRICRGFDVCSVRALHDTGMFYKV